MTPMPRTSTIPEGATNAKKWATKKMQGQKTGLEVNIKIGGGKSETFARGIERERSCQQMLRKGDTSPGVKGEKTRPRKATEPGNVKSC